MSDIVEQIRSYVREEMPIWDVDDFEKMLQHWPNQKEVTLYRGINFKTKEGFENFMKQLEENGGYIQNSASGFSEDFLTAEGFAHTSKSYFLDRETMKANSVQRILGERISGYRGVVLKTVAPAGTVVDVQSSGEAIENEYLFKPGQVIKVEVQELKTYYDLTQEPGFDVNKALEIEIMKQQHIKEPVLANSFANYLIINHSEEISNGNKTLICQNDLSLELQRRRNTKEEDISNENRTVLVNKPEVSVIYVKGGNSYRSKKDLDEIFFDPIDFSEYEEKDLLTPELKKALRKIASETLQEAMELHLEYRDNPNVDIHYEGISKIYEYLSKEEKNLHTRMISYNSKNKYEALNKKIAKNFNSGDRHSSIKEMTNFLNRIIEASPRKKEAALKRKAERNKAIEEAKKARMEMLGILPSNPLQPPKKLGL